MTIKEAIEYWEGLYKTFSSQIEKEADGCTCKQPLTH